MRKFIFSIPFLLVLTGCVHKTIQQNNDVEPISLEPVHNNVVVSPDIYTQNNSGKVDIIRQGRYTLINISPEDGQKYLLEQLVSVKLPYKYYYNLETGFRKTLLKTGIGLCSSSIDDVNKISTLFSRPLPKVHYKFGPMKLREALQMLAGPDYDLTIDNITRTVCFKLRESNAVKITEQKYEVITTSVKEEIIEE